jgi:hypothetical protein
MDRCSVSFRLAYMLRCRARDGALLDMLSICRGLLNRAISLVLAVNDIRKTLILPFELVKQ